MKRFVGHTNFIEKFLIADERGVFVIFRTFPYPASRRRSLTFRLGGLYFFAVSEEEDAEDSEDDRMLAVLVCQSYS